MRENLSTKKFLVTGATGFCGRNFVTYLAEQGAQVTCIVRPGSRSDFLKSLDVQILEGQLSDRSLLKQGIAGADTVFHLAGSVAAFSYEDMLAVNRGLTEEIVQVCAERETPPTLVYVSSLAAVGPSSAYRPHIEEDTPVPVSQYGRSKLEAENMLRRYANQVPITVIRPPSLFGPYDVEVRKWFEVLRKTRTFFVPILRPYRFSFLYVKDLILLLLLADERGERLPGDDEQFLFNPGQGVYFGGQTIHPSYLELGKMLGDAMGIQGVLTLGTPPVGYLAGYTWQTYCKWVRGRPDLPNLDKVHEGLAGSWTCSAEKARRQLGFRQEKTLQEQFRETAEWIAQH